jgi:hypothetical protein
MKKNFKNTQERVLFLVLLTFVSLNSFVLGGLTTKMKKNLYCSSRVKEISRDICYHFFYEKGKVDLLLLGFSSLWVDVDAKLLQRSLRKKLKSDYVVRTIGTNHPGEDLLYIFYNDISKHRRVNKVFASQPNRSTPWPHPYSHHVMGIDDIPLNITFIERLRYLSLISLRGAKNLASIFVPFGDEWTAVYSSKNFGSTPRDSKWKGHVLKSPTELSDEYSIDWGKSSYTAIPNESIFVNEEERITSFQERSMCNLYESVITSGAEFNFLYVPLYSDRRIQKLNFKMNLDYFKGVKVWGKASDDLFRGLSDRQVQSYFYNSNHLNSSGAELFTTFFSNGYIEFLL